MKKRIENKIVQLTIDVNSGTMTDSCDGILRCTCIFTPVFLFKLCHVYVTDDIIVHGDVLAHEKPDEENVPTNQLF